MKRKRNSRKDVKAQYAELAAKDGSCGSSHERPHGVIQYAESIGYSWQELKSVPDGAVVTHGCGNPTALAELKEGETVLDLGCGGGLDAFLAAQRVGPEGKVIGVDMTAEMIARARTNARKGNYMNIEFDVAEIEKLPIPDGSVDVVISNCVINHARDKLAVFREAHRVLKPGGRVFISDLVTGGRLSKKTLRDADKLWAGWLAVASDRQEYLKAMKAARFGEIAVVAEGLFPMAEADAGLKGKIISIHVKGSK